MGLQEPAEIAASLLDTDPAAHQAFVERWYEDEQAETYEPASANDYLGALQQLSALSDEQRQQQELVQQAEQARAHLEQVNQEIGKGAKEFLAEQPPALDRLRPTILGAAEQLMNTGAVPQTAEQTRAMLKTLHGSAAELARAEAAARVQKEADESWFVVDDAWQIDGNKPEERKSFEQHFHENLRLEQAQPFRTHEERGEIARQELTAEVERVEAPQREAFQTIENINLAERVKEPGSKC